MSRRYRRRRTGHHDHLIAAGIFGLVTGWGLYRLGASGDVSFTIGALVIAFILGGSVRWPHLRSPIVWRRTRRRRRW